jgi:hypothetical protein
VGAASFTKAISSLNNLLGSNVFLEPLRIRGWMMENIHRRNQHDSTICEAATAILDMKTLPLSVATFKRGGPGKVLTWIRRFQTMKCADDRDLVLALLSVAKNQASIKPNYRSPTNNIYINFACKLVEQGAIGIVLGMASYRRTEGSTGRVTLSSPGLPSWVPDFRCPLPSVNPMAMAGALLSPIHREVRDEEVKISDSGRMFTFQARIGEFITSGSDNGGRPKVRSAELHAVNIACWIPQMKEFSSGFVLTRMPNSTDCFRLIGDWETIRDREQKDILDFVENIRVETISLC